ncbi:MAG: hypothetical protein JXA61_09065 [Bacteroidales bacterium]|nr:hypothetical protein [Bacteroidales bacterium]
MRKLYAFASLFVIFGCLCLAQDQASSEIQGTSLQRLFSEIAQCSSDSCKEDLSEVIATKLDSLLRDPATFNDPFESLNYLGKIYSPDKKVRFYTWNLSYRDGSNRYYGFIQYRPDGTDVPLVYRLSDNSDNTEDPENVILNHDNWYGALVYEIVEQEHEGNMYYITLAYDPHNIFISRKIIDVLRFQDDIEPVFGYPFFSTGNGVHSRVLFEYSAKVQMTLRWAASLNMIVFDHLSPERPSYAGNYQFYGPDFSYDGFKFENGFWNLTEDIDIRNIPEAL